MLKWTQLVAMVGAGAMLAGCGFTDLEMAAKQRQIDALVAQVHALETAPAPKCGGVGPLRSAPVASRPVVSSR